MTSGPDLQSHTQMLPVVVVRKDQPGRRRAPAGSYSPTRLYRSRRVGRHVRRDGAVSARGSGFVQVARRAVKAEVVELLGSGGMWRPVWFVALVSAGAVLLVIGAVWSLTGQPNGFYLMLIAVTFFGLAAIMLSIFSWMRPKPPKGSGR